MTKRDYTMGLDLTQRLTAKEIVELEKSVKTLSHILTINSQILNDIIKKNHIIIGSMLNQFIAGHNEQVNAVVFMRDCINDMYKKLLEGVEE